RRCAVANGRVSAAGARRWRRVLGTLGSRAAGSAAAVEGERARRSCRLSYGYGPGARRSAEAALVTGAGELRVLQVIDSLGMGGAETWLMEVLRQFSANSAGEIDFLVTSGNAGLFDDEARRLGSRIYYLRYSRRNLGQFAAGYRRVLSTRRYH